MLCSHSLTAHTGVKIKFNLIGFTIIEINTQSEYFGLIFYLIISNRIDYISVNNIA